MSWIDLGCLDDIPLRGARKVKTACGDIAIFRTGEAEAFATDDRGAPKGGPLSEGIVHGQSVTCPIFGWVFDLTTGEAPSEGARVATYALRIEAGRVLLDSTALKGAA